MFKKLRNKFLLLNMLVTSVVVLTAFAAVYITTYSNTNAEIGRRLGNVSGSFVMSHAEGAPLPGDEPLNNENGDELLVTSHKVTADYIPSFTLSVDKDGHILEVNSQLDLTAEQYTEAAQTAWSAQDKTRMQFNGRTWAYRIAPVDITYSVNGETVNTQSSELLQLTFLDITDLQQSMRSLLMTFLFVGLGMLAVIFAVSLVYANNAIKPIAQSWEQQSQFIADASHELKTPLTTIMTNCDVLYANEAETVANQREWLGYIQIGANRMSKLVNSLLTLARLEGMGQQAEKQPFVMATLVDEVMQTMEAAAAAKQLHITRAVEPMDEVCGYGDSVRQVLTIVYENAIKYTEIGGHVAVSVRRAKKSVVCAVKNTGAGIAAKDLPHIFDRFYRADTARSGENSYGLGLSIAQSIAGQIGGRLTAKSVEHEWTELVFSFEC